MQIERRHLDSAVARGLIDPTQASALWEFLAAEQKDRPAFSFNHLLYYFGGLVAIGGISVFVTVGWEALGGLGLLLVALAIMAVAAWLTHYLLEVQKLPVPAGLMAALVVAASPLAAYGVQRMLGYWQPETTLRSYHYVVDWRWIVMELFTLAVGAAVLWRWRLPFSVMPIAVTLWYMSMDLSPLVVNAIAGGVDPDDQSLSWDERQKIWNRHWNIRAWVSVVVGLATVAGALAVDLVVRSVRDFGFWLHLAGLAAFWGGLTSMHSDSEVGKLVYFLINLALLAVGVVIGRRAYAVFGAMGCAAYLGHLSYKVFKDSLVFPLALMLIGLGVVWIGVLWQRREAQIEAALVRWTPHWLRLLRRAT